MEGLQKAITDYLRSCYDTYVPPHVQKRKREPWTKERALAMFKKSVHVPTIPILKWIRTYNVREVRPVPIW
jgi:hypothetical protein